MSEKAVKEAVAGEKLVCPDCGKPIRKYEKYAETIDSIQEGFNVQSMDSRGVRVTLVCGNAPCSWKERTEFWESFLKD